MKPRSDRLCVVTATTNGERAMACLRSWRDRAVYDFPLVVMVNGTSEPQAGLKALEPILLRHHVHGHLGVVPAFADGLEVALTHVGAEFFVCLHDDVLIEQDGWDALVLEHMVARPRCGLAGFGGGTGLGAADIYRTPYDPMQLARTHFISNMREAEAHGQRWMVPDRVACLDGFSQIGRRQFWQGVQHGGREWSGEGTIENLFRTMEELGIIHHAYDAALGCYAKRLGWETWMIPVACHHFGGVTAVADKDYHAWAETQLEGGDQEFWQRSHRLVYDEFKDVLPFTTER
jgi:hypothetical protein